MPFLGLHLLHLSIPCIAPYCSQLSCGFVIDHPEPGSEVEEFTNLALDQDKPQYI
jgi:hypothetical protein